MVILGFQLLGMKYIAGLHISQYHYRETLGGNPTDGHDSFSRKVDLNTIRASKHQQDVPSSEPLERRGED